MCVKIILCLISYETVPQITKEGSIYIVLRNQRLEDPHRLTKIQEFPLLYDFAIAPFNCDAYRRHKSIEVDLISPAYGIPKSAKQICYCG